MARTRSDAETRAVGHALTRVLVARDLVVLSGDLGAGKTTLTKGIATGLGIPEEITSPTFTLARRYEAALSLHHLDVYRLDEHADIVDLGLPELMDDDAVTVIEWGDLIASELGPDRLEIRLLLCDDDEERRIEVVAAGRSWHARTALLAEVLAPWTAEPGEGDPAR